MSKVDIIITTYRATDKLKRCIKSLIDKTMVVDFKCYIWANDPNNEVRDLLEEVRSKDQRFEPIYNKDNNGTFSSNNNSCAKIGNSEYILFLNDDVYAKNETWLLNMLSIMENDDSVGVVGAHLLYPNGLNQHCGVFISKNTNELPFHLFYRAKTTNFMEYNRAYQAVTGACMLVRRKDFDLVDGFNELYKYSYEDIDLCLKIKDKLNKISVYCAAAKLIHDEGISGTFNNHPNLQYNIKLFKKQWKNKWIDNLQLYLKNPEYLIYKRSVLEK